VDVEAHLEQLEALAAEARPVPLSGLVMVPRGEVEGVVEDLRAALPDELREARWLLRQRDEVLAAAAREADQIRAEAEADAARLRSETEVVRTAQREADRVLTEAKRTARQLQRDSEDYVEARLAAFEGVLQRTLDSVARGRQRLREGAGGPDLVELDGDPGEPARDRAIRLYDQEQAEVPRP
jgi:ABC-type transporter Mla subunit MlaD